MKVDLDLDKTNPNNIITDELLNNVGASAFNLEHDRFYGLTDMDIWTGAGSTGTNLIESTDYTLGDADIYLSGRAGANVYASVTVINATYQTGDLYFSYLATADLIEAGDRYSVNNPGGNVTFNDQYQTNAVILSQTNADGFSANSAYDSQTDFDWTVRATGATAINSLMAGINANRDDLYEYVELARTQGAIVGVAAGANLVGVDGITGVTPTGKTDGADSNLQEMIEGMYVALSGKTMDDAYNEGSAVTVDTTDVSWDLAASRIFKVTDSTDTSKFVITNGTGIDSVKVDTSGGIRFLTNSGFRCDDDSGSYFDLNLSGDVVLSHASTRTLSLTGNGAIIIRNTQSSSGIEINQTTSTAGDAIYIAADAGGIEIAGETQIELGTGGFTRVVIDTVGDTVFYGTASTTGALPVITLDQADLDEPFIKVIGDAASADLTRNIIDTGDVTTPTIVGYFKVEILDDGDQVTDGDYFIPFYSLA